MSWDNDTDMEFLQYYRAESTLWDPRHASYRDKVKRGEAWARIAACLRVPVPDVKRKKESMLSTYRKVRRGLAAAGGEGAQQPSWFAYEYIDEFLGDVTYYKTGPRQEQIKGEEHQEDDASVESEYFFFETEPDSHIGTSLGSAEKTPGTRRKTKRRRVDPLEDEGQNHERPAAAAHPQDAADESELYGRLLAMKLRRLPDLERSELMHAIDGLLLRRQQQRSAIALEVVVKEEASTP